MEGLNISSLLASAALEDVPESHELSEGDDDGFEVAQKQKRRSKAKAEKADVVRKLYDDDHQFADQGGLYSISKQKYVAGHQVEGVSQSPAKTGTPSQDPRSPRKSYDIFVKHLPKDCTKDDFKDVFSK